jgi:hypothetical protein
VFRSKVCGVPHPNEGAVVPEFCEYSKQRVLANPLLAPYREGMRTELAALKNLISEADLILETLPPLPENRTARCRELLASALALTGDLLKQAKTPAAIALGRKGGQASAAKGSDYFRKLAAKRKTHGGGRPRKQSE